jgi:streptogramin lyase
MRQAFSVLAVALIVVAGAAAATPLTFVWPTSIELQPDGSLLLVENGVGRVVRIDPVTGKMTPVASSLARAYAVARTPSGRILVSAGKTVRRLNAAGAATIVAEAEADIGPIAIARNGDVYYTTGTRLYRLAGGTGPPLRIAGTVQFSGPHGLAVATDGTVLVSDTGNGRIRRIDPTNGLITTFAALRAPRGIDVATDGSIYVVDATAHRVVHLSASGRGLGFVGPVFKDPYDVQVARDGVVYVIDTAAAGRLRRVGRDGTMTTVSRR